VQIAFTLKCELIAFTWAAPNPILALVKTPDSAADSARNSAATLAELPDGKEGTVAGLSQVPGLSGAQASALVTRLRDLGFVAGAQCKVVARMWPGGDPIAVRVGGSTFALRRAEALAVQLGAGS